MDGEGFLDKILEQELCFERELGRQKDAVRVRDTSCRCDSCHECRVSGSISPELGRTGTQDRSLRGAVGAHDGRQMTEGQRRAARWVRAKAKNHDNDNVTCQSGVKGGHCGGAGEVVRFWPGLEDQNEATRLQEQLACGNY